MKTSQRFNRMYLDELYERYNRFDCIAPDPLQFLYHYSDPADQEVVGFLSALLAYGRVAQIQNSLDHLFGIMGDHPCDFVRGFGQPHRKRLADYRHRFTSGDDLSELFVILRQVLTVHRSIESVFVSGFRASDKTILPALESFCGFLSEESNRLNGRNLSRGLKYLIGGPKGKSPCKRLNLFLRWMIRRDNVDPGLWTKIGPEKLVMPVDTHIARICRNMGLHIHKNPALNTAVQITGQFWQLCPEDPVRYDFALCRSSMEGFGCDKDE